MLVSWIRSNFGVSPLMIVVSLVLAYAIFMTTLHLMKLKIRPASSAIIAVIVIWAT
jgi:hypothetical protein